MKFNNIYSKIILAVLVVIAIGFTACSSDSKSDTVILEAFGPSPALRGGELRFIGHNLDKVTEIILPENISITNIEQISTQEIKITIPQNALPGYVVLKAPSGDIISKTQLTFSEPISISKFYKTGTDGETSVLAGDEVTFEGDYLNLIREVIFSDDILVSLDREDGQDYPRESFTVKVPLAAQTGKITLSNGADIPIKISTESDLTVAVPSVISISPTTIKVGETLTIEGEHLQLVETIRFESNIEVTIPSEEEPFAERTKIQVIVPEKAQAGEIVLVGYSGIETNAGMLTMVLPEATTLTPNPVKNGEQLTLEGTNLDLVTSLIFPNVGDAVDVQATETKIIVTVPETAQAGELQLVLESGVTVPVNYMLVTPAVSSISSPAIGGKSLTFNGTDIDLISDVAFSSSSEKVEITSQTTTSITVDVPNTVLGNNNVSFTLKNGSVVEVMTLYVTPTELAYITSSLPAVDSGATLTFSGGNFDKVTNVTLDGATVKWGIADASTMFVAIPSGMDTGRYTLELTTSGGSVTYTVQVMGTGPEIITIWTGTFDSGDWDNLQLTDASLFDRVEVGDQILVTVDPSSIKSDSQGSFKTNVSGWPAIGPDTEHFDITGSFTLDITEQIRNSLLSTGLIVTGQNYVATEISIIHY